MSLTIIFGMKLDLTNYERMMGMPLTFASIGQLNKIVKIKGQDKVIKFLESLGFVEGADVTIVSHMSGNVIVNIKDSRVAISKEMANKIMVEGV